MQHRTALLEALDRQIKEICGRLSAAESGLFTPIPQIVERDRAKLSALQAKWEAIAHDQHPSQFTRALHYKKPNAIETARSLNTGVTAEMADPRKPNG